MRARVFIYGNFEPGAAQRLSNVCNTLGREAAAHGTLPPIAGERHTGFGQRHFWMPVHTDDGSRSGRVCGSSQPLLYRSEVAVCAFRTELAQVDPAFAG